MSKSSFYFFIGIYSVNPIKETRLEEIKEQIELNLGKKNKIREILFDTSKSLFNKAFGGDFPSLPSLSVFLLVSDGQPSEEDVRRLRNIYLFSRIGLNWLVLER